MPFGYALLSILTVLSVVAAAAVVVRCNLESRAERLVATAMVWNGVVIVPIYVLGFTNTLYRGVLAGVSAAWFAIVLAIAMRGRDRREMMRAVGAFLVEVLALPRDAVRECAKRGSLIAIGVFAAIFVTVWSVAMTWYAADWGQWDSPWYHDPMIGWAIQNHGFAVVPLPISAEKTNGYPRLVEMTQMWFVIFTDRRLIELANSFFAPVLAVATYALCRRYTRDKVAAMGWGAALLLTPLVSILLETTYVDIHYAAFLMGAIYFATRPTFRLRDAYLTSLCLMLSIGAKYMALVPVPLIGFVALVRLVRLHWGSRRREVVLASVIGLTAIAAMACTTYLKNYLAFHNPLWPDVKVDIDRLGIHWPGLSPMFGAPGTAQIDMNIPMQQLLGDLYTIPYSKSGSYLYQSFDYGFAVTYMILPLSALSFLAALGALAGRTWQKRKLRRTNTEPERSRAGDTAWNCVVVGFLTLALLATTPALWGARYNIAPVACMMALCSWLGGLRGFARLGHGAATVAVFSGAIMCSWAVPRWYFTPAELFKLAQIPYPEREVTHGRTVAPTIAMTRGAPITKDVGLLREKELGPGKIIVFDEEYGAYLAAFWNLKFSNKAIYAPMAKLVPEAERLGATWIFCTHHDPAVATLRAPGSGWQEIGTFNVENWGVVFRRVH